MFPQDHRTQELVGRHTTVGIELKPQSVGRTTAAW
jgi:hypothetical protein